MSQIVLIHGMWSTGSTLEPVASYFRAQGYHTVSPTLPDHVAGESASARLAEYSVRDYVAFLSETVQVDDETIIVGHSMGGLLAQFLAAKFNPRALILLASAGPRGTNCFHVPSAISMSHANFRWKFWARAHKPGWWLARYAMWNLLPRKKARQLFEQLTYESGRAFAEIVYWMFDRQRAIQLDLEQIKCPTLLLGGKKDHIIVPSITRKLARRFPRSELCLFPNHAHWLFDEPGCEQVFQKISDWLHRHQWRAEPGGTENSDPFLPFPLVHNLDDPTPQQTER